MREKPTWEDVESDHETGLKSFETRRVFFPPAFLLDLKPSYFPEFEIDGSATRSQKCHF